MGRTKTMHARRSTCLSGHCTALAWPGGAVVAAVMAPVEGKNAKMTKSLSGSRTGSGAFSGLLCEKIRFFLFRKSVFCCFPWILEELRRFTRQNQLPREILLLIDLS